jgi:hypothetical protein
LGVRVLVKSKDKEDGLLIKPYERENKIIYLGK